MTRPSPTTIPAELSRPRVLPGRCVGNAWRSRGAGVITGALCLVMGLAPAAYTQTPPPASVADNAAAVRADQYADLGRDAYRSGNYEAAYQQFQLAYGADRRAVFLFNIAKCFEKLGRYADAREQFKAYLERYKNDNGGRSAPNEAAVRSLMSRMDEHIFRQNARVIIGSTPPGAQVTRVLDGRPLGTTPLRIQLKPGIYKVRLELPGYESLDADLMVPANGKVRAAFTLQKHRDRAALRIWVNVRRAKIEVDGKVRAVSPYDGRFDLRPGRHRVRIKRRGYEPIEEIIEIPIDRELHIHYVLKAKAQLATWRSWVGWPTFAAGVGGVGSGALASVQADRYYRDSREFELFTGYQDVGFGVGGAAMGIGLGLVLWDAFRNTVPAAELVKGRQHSESRKLKPLDARSIR